MFMLEAFTFISGYLFVYIIKVKKKEGTFKQLFTKKAKRLLIPSIIFGFVYSNLYMDKDILSLSYLYELLCGVAHMWYLPMLFWSMMGTFLLLKLKIDERSKLLALFILSLVSYIPLPFRMSSTCYYLFFFYLGGYFIQHKDELIKSCRVKSLILQTVICLALFFILFDVREYLNLLYKESNVLRVKALLLSISNLCKLIYATYGVYLLYLWSLYATARITLPESVARFNGKCYGIYLFQQFILIFLYYHTNLPQMVGTYWLPWIGFSIAMLGSTLLATLFLKTRAGRFLIG